MGIHRIVVMNVNQIILLTHYLFMRVFLQWAVFLLKKTKGNRNLITENEMIELLRSDGLLIPRLCSNSPAAESPRSSLNNTRKCGNANSGIADELSTLTSVTVYEETMLGNYLSNTILLVSENSPTESLQKYSPVGASEPPLSVPFHISE